MTTTTRAGVLTGVLLLILSLIDVRLRQHGHGILEFEFARTAERAQSIVQQWGADGRRLARITNGVDCLFVTAYATWLTRLAHRRGSRSAALAVGCAALADLIQNAALFAGLANQPTATAAPVAWVAGIITATLLVAVILRLLIR